MSSSTRRDSPSMTFPVLSVPLYPLLPLLPLPPFPAPAPFRPNSRPKGWADRPPSSASALSRTARRNARVFHHKPIASPPPTTNSNTSKTVADKMTQGARSRATSTNHPGWPRPTPLTPLASPSPFRSPRSLSRYALLNTFSPSSLSTPRTEQPALSLK